MKRGIEIDLMAAADLERARRYLGFEWQRIAARWPGAEDMQNLRFRRSLRHSAALPRFLRNLVADYRLDEFLCGEPEPRLEPTPGETYLGLLGRLQSRTKDTVHRPHPFETLEDTLAKYDAFVDEQFVRRLVDHALHEEELEDRVLYQELVSLVRMRHRMVPTIIQLERRSAQATEENEGGILPREAFAQFVRLSDQIQKLVFQLLDARRR